MAVWLCVQVRGRGLSLQPTCCTPTLSVTQKRHCSCSCGSWRYLSVICLFVLRTVTHNYVILLATRLFEICLCVTGSVLDTGLYEQQPSKTADLLTFNSTLDSVMRSHFPSVCGSVAVRLVPCPNICSDALSLLAR